MGPIQERLADLRGDWTPTDHSVRVRVTEARIAVASDVHIPYHDERLLAHLLETAFASGMQAVVFLGDLMDMPTHSHYDPDDFTTTFERELTITEGVIRTAVDLGLRVYWSYGNHEARFLRRTGSQISMKRLAYQAGLGDLLADGTLVMSDNPTLEYGDDWLLTHPDAYGASPLVKAGQFADKEAKHVVAGHSHHWAKGKSPSGQFTVVESGGLFDPKLFKYIQHSATTNRRWTRGFVLLDHGEAYLFDGTPRSRSLVADLRSFLPHKDIA